MDTWQTKKDISYNNFLREWSMNLVSHIIGKERRFCCFSSAPGCMLTLREAGFNIYMSIKHEHSIIILLSYLLWALRAWSLWIYMNVYTLQRQLFSKWQVANGAITKFSSSQGVSWSFIIYIFLQCTWHIIGSQACNLMHCFL